VTVELTKGNQKLDGLQKNKPLRGANFGTNFGTNFEEDCMELKLKNRGGRRVLLEMGFQMKSLKK
jgi:hypothetical protein